MAKLFKNFDNMMLQEYLLNPIATPAIRKKALTELMKRESSRKKGYIKTLVGKYKI